jgi:hypothetical protein
MDYVEFCVTILAKSDDKRIASQKFSNCNRIKNRGGWTILELLRELQSGV